MLDESDHDQEPTVEGEPPEAASPEVTSAEPLNQEQLAEIVEILSVGGSLGPGPRLTERSPGVLLRRGREFISGLPLIS